MSETVEVRLPDIGDFDQVDVIEVLVAEGDQVQQEDSLVTLESDKATMEIPSPYSGTVKKLKVAVGDKIAEGGVVLDMEIETETASAEAAATEKPAGTASVQAVTASAANPDAAVNADMHAEVLVLGAGPGGYTAAFRAADLGKKTVLIEKYADLGGVCLNVGCIPSKALLHAAAIINESDEIKHMGVRFTKPEIDLDEMRNGKDKVVKRLTGGLGALAKQRKVEVVTGTAGFSGPNSMTVETSAGSKTISFDYCIIACGSSAVKIPSFPNDDPRLIDSTGALALQNIPAKMLVIGGGIIGLELATVYSALGSKIDIVSCSRG